MLVTPLLMARRGDVQISAERLKARREARFMSQAELASAAGMGLSNVQRLERGQLTALMRTGIPKLAAALRMSEQEFMDQIAVTVVGADDRGRANGGRIEHRYTATNTPAKPPAPESQPQGMRPVWVSAETYGQLEYLAAKHNESVETHVALYAKNSTTRRRPINPDPPSAQPPKVSPAPTADRRRKRDGKEMENANH